MTLIFVFSVIIVFYTKLTKLARCRLKYNKQIAMDYFVNSCQQHTFHETRQEKMCNIPERREKIRIKL